MSQLRDTIREAFDDFDHCDIDDPVTFDDLAHADRERVIDEFIKSIPPAEVMEYLTRDDYEQCWGFVAAFMVRPKPVLMEAVRAKLRSSTLVIDAIEQEIERTFWDHQKEVECER